MPWQLGARARLSLVVLAVFVLQTTLFADLRPLGVAPELPLLVAIHAGRWGGAERGALVGFATGLLYDVQLVTPLGLWAAAGAVVAWGMGSLAEALHRPGGVIWSVSTGLASAFGVVLVALAGGVMGQSGMVDVTLVRVALLVGVLNSVLSPLAGRVLRWALRPSLTLRSA